VAFAASNLEKSFAQCGRVSQSGHFGDDIVPTARHRIPLNCDVHHLWVGRRLFDLCVTNQFLGHSFPRSKAGEDDLDVSGNPQTAQACKSARERGNRHLLPHIENISVPRLSEGSTLQDQSHGLTRGHEEAADVGMSDRNWAALADLALELRQDAPPAAQNIPESHRGEDCGRLRQ
jgi:hypothetical protein